MKRIKLAGLVALVLGTTTAAWFAALPVAGWLSSLASENQIRTFGATGDLFGVVTSFFSGLAALGLIIILALDRENRLNSNPPLVSIGVTRATVKNASYGDDGMDLQADVALMLNNLTAVPALNPKVTVSGGTVWTIHGDDTPITQADGRPVTLKLRQLDKAGERNLTRLNTQDGIELSVKLTYTALDKARWSTSVKIRILTKHTDRQSISKILAHDEQEYISQVSDSGSTDVLELDTEFVTDTWRHQRE